MIEIKKIIIAENFSKFPAGRYKSDGKYTGEHFRDDCLIPELQASKKLTIYLDGVAGYGSSFLEEVFGGLVRKNIFSKDELDKKIILKTEDTLLKIEITSYMDDAWKSFKSK